VPPAAFAVRWNRQVSRDQSIFFRSWALRAWACLCGSSARSWRRSYLAAIGSGNENLGDHVVLFGLQIRGKDSLANGAHEGIEKRQAAPLLIRHGLCFGRWRGRVISLYRADHLRIGAEGFQSLDLGLQLSGILRKTCGCRYKTKDKHHRQSR